MSRTIREFWDLNIGKDLRKIFANTIWLYAGRFLRMGVGLFVWSWTARYLGVEQFGLLSYAIAFVALFKSFSNLGLPTLVVRKITHEIEKKEQILGTTFCLHLIGGMTTWILALITVSLISDDRLVLGLVGILALSDVFRAFETIDIWFQSQVQSKYTIIAKNIAFLITTVFNFILIRVEAPVFIFGCVIFSEVLISAIGLTIFYKLKGFSFRTWRWSSALARSLLKESWPLILSGLSIVIYLKADQIMLSEILGNESVGIYSSAVRLSEVWFFIPVGLASSFAPSIYRAKKSTVDPGLYYRRIEQLLKLLSLISILIAIPITFLSTPIIILIFGEQYLEASPVLTIHVWSSLFVFLGTGASSWFIAEGLNHLTFRRTLMGGIINVLLNLLLIPVYAEVGAAISTVVSYAIGSVFANALDRRTRKIFFIQLNSVFFWKSLKLAP